ncbi:alpha-L-rhamnosidase [Xanthomonas sp. SI]|uniref:alpha-L-rhamnosidase n=1 Tax=Xanthomonas sp. SI TaxID=2724123 RepID=UPI001639D20F|nr:alpha-L-rhamnosidase [Xanthomonas sp. SI]QNH11349.1 Alpha-L-rhamnosidase [Xanthomonas sp. SI]
MNYEGPEGGCSQQRRRLLKSMAILPPASALVNALAGEPGESVAPVALGIRAPRVEWRIAPLGIDTLRPRFDWQLQGVQDGARHLRQQAYHLRVASSLESLRAGRADVWDSGRVPGEHTRATPFRDLPLRSQQRYWWSLRVWDRHGRASAWSEPASFATGILTAADWRARWIVPAPVDGAEALPLLRRSFTLPADKRVRQALLSISGLGQYLLSLNGQALHASLDPGWTNYRKTVLYNTYDLAPHLLAGANTLGVMLGNGMYNVPDRPGRYTKFVGSFGALTLIAQLRVLFEDGSEQWLLSDEAWQSRSGPVTFSSIYGGEDVDARRATAGWDTPHSELPGWTSVIRGEGPGGTLRAQATPSVLPVETFAPVAVQQPRPGVYVYDFGSNFSGRPRLQVRAGRAGQTIRLTPGEALDAAGLVSQRSYGARADFATYFSYTVDGAGTQTFHPRFTYHGFRYLQVEGAAPAAQAQADMPAIEALHGEFMHADLPRSGRFDCSLPLLVDTHRIIERALLSNTVSIFTDCPHREKLGWLEQTYLNADTALYNLDAITLYEKMGQDILDSQLDDGLVPSIAPEYTVFADHGRNNAFRDSPEWGIAAVLSPWAAYRRYGDPHILEQNYAGMRRYLAYLQRQAHDDILDYGLGDWYDIGPKEPGEAQLTSKAVTATAVYYEALDAMARIAAILRRPAAEREAYRQRAAAVKHAYNARLFDPARNRYDRGSQTAQAMPLVVGLVPSGREAEVLANLVATIRADGNAVTAGDVGFHYVVRALTEYRRADVMMAMLALTDRPSYGYQLAHGMTSLAEAWDANPAQSLNHFMLGHAEAWLYGGLGGVSVDFARADGGLPLRIAPQPVAAVDHASVAYESTLGRVESVWHQDRQRLWLDVAIPPGATAQVILPTTEAAAIREGGRPLAHAGGVLRVDAWQGQVALTLGSGRYGLEAPLAPR